MALKIHIDEHDAISLCSSLGLLFLVCRGCYWWRNLLTFQMTFSIRRSVQVPRLSLCGADSTSHQSNVNSQFGTLLCLEVPGVSLYWRRGGLWVIRRSSFHSMNTFILCTQDQAAWAHSGGGACIQHHVSLKCVILVGNVPTVAVTDAEFVLYQSGTFDP